MGCFVVDNPKRVITGLHRFEAGSEKTVNTHQPQTSRNNAGPAGFADSFGVRRENPLSEWVARCVAGDVEGLRCDVLACAREMPAERTMAVMRGPHVLEGC